MSRRAEGKRSRGDSKGKGEEGNRESDSECYNIKVASGLSLSSETQERIFMSMQYIISFMSITLSFTLEWNQANVFLYSLCFLNLLAPY